MTSYSATVINKNIEHLFLSPFLHWLSPLDPVRIQEQIELEMLRKRVRGISRHGILPINIEFELTRICITGICYSCLLWRERW